MARLKISANEKSSSFHIQVGKSKRQKKLIRYSDVPTVNGWVLDMRYRPIKFDMTLLKIKDKRQSVPGWWNGIYWEGLHLQPTYEILAWKRHSVYE
jgi:hypothetical protein